MRGDLLGLAVAACGFAAVASFWLRPPQAVPTGDERDYVLAAVHLARSGVLSSAPLSRAAPPRDAYREPGYSFLLASYWRLAQVPLPEETPKAWTDLSGAAARGVAVVGAFLLAATAAGAGIAARLVGASGQASLAAAVLVVASPALRQAALVPGSEGLAAALVTLAACGLGRAVVRGGGGGIGAIGAIALAGLATGLCPLARGAAIALIPAGVLVLLMVPRSVSLRRRTFRAAVFACFALIPVAAWMTRNSHATGHFVLADRGGAVLWTRAELNLQVAREGILPAILAWTPLESARRAGERRWPDASYSRYQWEGEGNFFTRAMREWRAVRRSSADPLAADLALGRKALGQFLSRPGDHVLAGLAVAWRGWFAERSPELVAPFDLTFALGLLLAGAVVWVLFTAIRSGGVGVLVLLAGPVALFLLHAATTEFLPRFSVPGLPLIWAALVVTISPARAQRGRRMGEDRDSNLPEDRTCAGSSDH